VIGNASLSNVLAHKLPVQDEERHHEEFLALIAIFEKLLYSIPNDMESWEVMEELMALRADFAIHHALNGFGLEYDTALDLLRTAEDGLTEAEKAKRNVIVAAVDNLVDFAVAEEYQMALELPEFEAELEEDDLEEVMAIFAKYNDRYALIENQDAEYAMIIAAQLLAVSNSTVLTYMTQGDERVRPWHLQYEGYSAPKSSFPAWLIPPIEHACRCYLVEDSVIGKLQDVQGAVIRVPDMPEWFNPTFKESVALGGRIFSDEHPYFQVQGEHKEILQSIADRIKSKYLNG
jgi:hypothetical protein